MSTLGETLDELALIIAARAADGSASTSYTKTLLDAGTIVCAKKFGEEAVETTLAAATGDNLAGEAADTLYHLLVLLQAAGVSPSAVAAELNQRRGVSGLAEKASRRP